MNLNKNPSAPGKPEVGDAVVLVRRDGSTSPAKVAVVNLDGTVNLDVGQVSYLCDVPFVPEEALPSRVGWRRPKVEKKTPLKSAAKPE